MKVYHYPKCSTCQRALKFLGAQTLLTYEAIDIVQQPPSVDELKQMLKYYSGDLRKLFNTSGMLYREMGLKDRLAEMSEAEALKLLSEQGMLVKRPFILSENGGCVGFKETEWQDLVAG